VNIVRAMRPMICIVPVLAGLALLAFGAAPPSISKAPEFPAKLPTFGEPDAPGWTRVNDRWRQRMDPATAFLCRTPPPETAAHELQRRGAHTQAYTETFVNDTGKAAMFSEKTPIVFPVGSVIIKVKYAKDEGGDALLRTVMIKREKGYNSACGDWEFVATDKAGLVTGNRGKLESCMACHQRAHTKPDDFTFRRDYLPYPLLEKLWRQKDTAPNAPSPGITPKPGT
jgi:hypothetical protein